MYSKQEASLIRQQFWTSFGQYMAPVPSASGEKINWINYKTGIKNISFKMDADNNRAYIAVEFSHNDLLTRAKHFSFFQSVKDEFVSTVPGDWIWSDSKVVNERQIAVIYDELNHVNIFRREDWPSLISFFKERITGIDRFWTEYKEVLEML